MDKFFAGHARNLEDFYDFLKSLDFILGSLEVFIPDSSIIDLLHM